MARAPNAVANDTAARHARALPISSQLTAYYRRTHRPETVMVTPEPIIAALNEAGVRFVLMGTHGIGGWRDQARATQDVDVLVRKRDHKKAVAAIQRLYPALKMQDTAVVTRFLEPADNQPVIDLMKPSQAVFAMVFSEHGACRRHAPRSQSGDGAGQQVRRHDVAQPLLRQEAHRRWRLRQHRAD